VSKVRKEINRDTPAQSGLNPFQKSRVRRMGIQRNRSVGRPSKGDRHVVTARIPTAEAEKLFAIAEALGTSASSFIADVMSEKLASMDLEQLTNQEALPLSKAS
jgi:hypothetical protein